MRKILISGIVLVLMFGLFTKTTYAFSLDDVMKELTALRAELTSLKNSLKPSVLGATTTSAGSTDPAPLPPILLACVINSFTASPNLVPERGSTTISWSTTGCSSIDLMGVTSTGEAWDRGINTNVNGSEIFGPTDWNFVYGNTGVYTFMIRAADINGDTVTKTIYVNIQKETNDECLYVKGPFIKVISPNGGEVYQPGQQITVKWKSCNLTASQQIFVDIWNPSMTNLYRLGQTANDGSEVFILPTSTNWANMLYGKNFILNILTPIDYLGQPNYSDSSDNLFTIGLKATSVCTSVSSVNCGNNIIPMPPVPAPKAISSSVGPATTVGPQPPIYDGKSASSISSNITYGQQRSDDVLKLQAYLKQKGYLSVSPTGNFGRKTLEAVRKFQAANDLPSSGFVGPRTIAKIKYLLSQSTDDTYPVPMPPVPLNNTGTVNQ